MSKPDSKIKILVNNMKDNIKVKDINFFSKQYAKFVKKDILVSQVWMLIRGCSIMLTILNYKQKETHHGQYISKKKAAFVDGKSQNITHKKIIIQKKSRRPRLKTWGNFMQNI